MTVVVVGAGQAGLSVSYELTRTGVDHIVIERGRVGQTWRTRWDSFCLVTPNWSVRLPGHHYDGDDPDGFMARDEVVSYLERYAAAAPVKEGVEVTALRPRTGGGFVLETPHGALGADTVVLATGAYQRSHRPPVALPADLLQIDVADYRNPDELPEGSVLVVGCGQSGVQIAEELHEAGREVVLSCGKAPWLPRRVGEHDLFWWLVESGYTDRPLSSLPSPAGRLAANPQSTGHGGGHDLHFRTLRAMGVTLVGRLAGVEGSRLRFAPDLADSVAWGDQRYFELMRLIREHAAERGLPQPDLVEPEPFDPTAPEELDLSGFGAVIFAGGFRPDHESWVDCPGAFDKLGFPVHEDGASTAAPGLYFVGVHFLRKRKSALLIGVGEDAEIVAGRIAREG